MLIRLSLQHINKTFISALILNSMFNPSPVLILQVKLPMIGKKITFIVLLHYIVLQ